MLHTHKIPKLIILPLQYYGTNTIEEKKDRGKYI